MEDSALKTTLQTASSVRTDVCRASKGSQAAVHVLQARSLLTTALGVITALLASSATKEAAAKIAQMGSFKICQDNRAARTVTPGALCPTIARAAGAVVSALLALPTLKVGRHAFATKASAPAATAVMIVRPTSTLMRRIYQAAKPAQRARAPTGRCNQRSCLIVPTATLASQVVKGAAAWRVLLVQTIRISRASRRARHAKPALLASPRRLIARLPGIQAAEVTARTAI